MSLYQLNDTYKILVRKTVHTVRNKNLVEPNCDSCVIFSDDVISSRTKIPQRYPAGVNSSYSSQYAECQNAQKLMFQVDKTRADI